VLEKFKYIFDNKEINESEKYKIILNDDIELFIFNESLDQIRSGIPYFEVEMNLKNYFDNSLEISVYSRRDFINGEDGIFIDFGNMLKPIFRIMIDKNFKNRFFISQGFSYKEITLGT